MIDPALAGKVALVTGAQYGKDALFAGSARARRMTSQLVNEKGGWRMGR